MNQQAVTNEQVTMEWRVEKLKDVLQKTSSTDPRKKPEIEFEYIDVSSVSRTTFSIQETTRMKGVEAPSRARRHVKSGDVIFATIRPTLQRVAIVPDNLNEQVCSTGYFILRPKPELYNRFVYYYLFTESFMYEMERRQKGASYPAVNDGDVRDQVISFPPLPEQKRIVAIMDEAFAGISQAVANAEKNLVNARELFESYLNNVFTQKVEGWVKYQLQELTTKIGSGATPKGGASSYKDEGISLIRSLNVHDRHFTDPKLAYIDDAQADKLSNVIIEEGDVLFNITGASVARCCVAPTEYLPARVNQHVSILRPKQDELLTDFLCYLMTSRIYKDILLGIGDEGGSTRQAITKKQLQELTVFIPASKDEQKKVIDILDELSLQSQHLESIYQQKFNALIEFKKSILQKAFAGELTADMKTASSKAVNVKTTSPEFTARVLAFAHHRHVSQQRDKTFGRVKAQKILHLTESIGGIDLGREPIKDAAGPNDFKHMLRAEAWAKTHQFFEFVERDNGYDFKKLGHYDEMMAEALTITSPYQKKLDRIIDLLLLMNSRKAEIFATVHAAWNNLILNGDKITDEVIIREARENWHPDKMKIPVSEFREAIRLIRNKKLVPDGKAKRVSGQENLF